MTEKQIETIKSELAKMIYAKPDEIRNLEIFANDHNLDFRFYQNRYWAKLHKNNLHVKNNSLRLITW